MNLAIITSNVLFRESLESLLENYELKNGKSIIIKDFDFEKTEELDVILSDYDSSKLKEFLLNAKIQKNKLRELEKILISQKRPKLLPKNNIYLKRPFRFVELVDVLQSILARMKNKKENNRIFGYISYVISDRKLTYKNKLTVELTEKESDILLYLLSSGDRGITKEEVMSQVWMLNPNMETHTFETHLYRLRKKIKERLFFDNVIVNKDGRFYLNQEFMGQKN